MRRRRSCTSDLKWWRRSTHCGLAHLASNCLSDPWEIDLVTDESMFRCLRGIYDMEGTIASTSSV